MASAKLQTAALVIGVVAVSTAQAQPAKKPQAPPPAAEIHVTNDPSRVWGELQIAVNPKNPNNIVYVIQGHRDTAACAAAQDPDCEVVQAKMGSFPLSQPRGFFGPNAASFNIQGVFVSFDRGHSWKRYLPPAYPRGFPRLTGHGDPSVTASPDGTFYMSWDANDWGSVDNALPVAGVGISKSTDGGRTWSPPVLTGTPVDGPKTVADPVTGTVYAASSTQLGPRSTGDPKTPLGTITSRWLVRSKDGVHWSTPQPMGGVGGSMSAAFGMLATGFTTGGQAGPFGGASNDLCGKAPAPCAIFQTTADGGTTWDRHVLPANPQGGGVVVAADPTKKGHFAVLLPMKAGGEHDIYQTFDAGKTWTGPAVVAEDVSKPNYHTVMAYSPNGVLGIVWRARQPQPAGAAPPPPAAPGGFGGPPPAPYDAWAAISRDGGASFSRPMRLSTANSPASPPGPFRGAGDDYSGMAMDREYLYAGWADWRPGERGGYFRAVNFSAFQAK